MGGPQLTWAPVVIRKEDYIPCKDLILSPTAVQQVTPRLKGFKQKLIILSRVSMGLLESEVTVPQKFQNVLSTFYSTSKSLRSVQILVSLFDIFYIPLFWPCFSTCGILVSQPGIKSVALALEAWSLNHREPPGKSLSELSQMACLYLGIPFESTTDLVS